MKNILSNTTVYPGAFVPMMEKGAFRHAIKDLGHKAVVHPPLHMVELPDAYKIELQVPGVNRQDFLVQCKHRVLSVTALHRTGIAAAGEENIQPAFKDECFECRLQLPENADPLFVSAEYREGVLRLYLPKTNAPAQGQRCVIIVY